MDRQVQAVWLERLSRAIPPNVWLKAIGLPEFMKVVVNANCPVYLTQVAIFVEIWLKTMEQNNAIGKFDGVSPESKQQVLDFIAFQ